MSRNSLLICLIAFITLAFYVEEVIELQYPKNFPTPTYDFEKNKLTQAKVDLGRALFYDPILSVDNSISCASCHSPYNAFAHSDHQLSHGIKDSIGTRNAPALFNLAWNKSFMWDGAIHHLDMQALAPISHSAEMGSDIIEVVKKLAASNIYPELFFEAYQDTNVTGEKILKAISQFQLTLVSANSKYDQVKKAEAIFTKQEISGYELFKANCNSCHTEPLFTNQDFASNGLSVDTTLNDYGKVLITKNPLDSFQFKIPSLRNLSFSAPYMHDGRFSKLGEILNHYNEGVDQESYPSKALKHGLQLTSNEKVDLIAFLLTLNDKSFVFNTDHHFPREILLSSEGSIK